MMNLSSDFDDDVSDDLYEHYKIIADPGQAPLRIDRFLVDRVPKLSRSKIAEAAKDGFVHVNGHAVKQNHKVKPYDEVSIVFTEPKRELQLIPEKIDLDIVYEDNDLLVVNKPSNFVVHPGHGNYTGTLVNALLYHFGSLPSNPSSETAFPGLVHRIDKDTTGLLVVAKREDVLTHLAGQFFERTTSRNYIALVWGDVADDKGTITGNIGRSLSDRKQMAVFEDESLGKPAITHYEVLERLGYVTLVRCKLDTGRTHQIRVHMKHIGHTLFGDVRYGGDKILKGTTFTKYKQFIENCFELMPRQALHAKTLGFKHPKKDKWMEFESPLPDDFTQLLEKWRRYVKSTHGDIFEKH